MQCKGLVSYTDSPAPMRMRLTHAAMHYPMHLHNSAYHMHVYIIVTGSTTKSLYILALVLQTGIYGSPCLDPFSGFGSSSSLVLMLYSSFVRAVLPNQNQTIDH